MFRTIVMFPASAGQQRVDDLLAQTATAFKERPTFRGMTTNVDALMGPSAKGGAFSCLFEADFDDLDDLLGALNAESFQEVRAATEALEPVLLIYECREV